MRSGRHLTVALAKAELIRFYNSNSFGREDVVLTKKMFVSEYNRPDSSYPKLYQIVGPISFSSLERWKLRLERSGGDPSSLIDSRGIRWTRKRKRVRRTCARLIWLITAVPPQTRDKWFRFLEGLRDGKPPDEIATLVGVSIHTIYRWTRRLTEF
jgi:transposase